MKVSTKNGFAISFAGFGFGVSLAALAALGTPAKAACPLNGCTGTGGIPVQTVTPGNSQQEQQQQMQQQMQTAKAKAEAMASAGASSEAINANLINLGFNPTVVSAVLNQIGLTNSGNNVGNSGASVNIQNKYTTPAPAPIPTNAIQGTQNGKFLKLVITNPCTGTSEELLVPIRNESKTGLSFTIPIYGGGISLPSKMRDLGYTQEDIDVILLFMAKAGVSFVQSADATAASREMKQFSMKIGGIFSKNQTIIAAAKTAPFSNGFSGCTGRPVPTTQVVTPPSVQLVPPTQVVRTPPSVFSTPNKPVKPAKPCKGVTCG